MQPPGGVFWVRGAPGGVLAERAAGCVCVRVRACVRGVGAQKADNARERVCVRVIARNALLARRSGLWRVLARRPTNNSTDPPKRLKTSYRAL